MKVITVCGSMKYKKEMIEVAEYMALMGNCIITPIYLTKDKSEYITSNYLTLAEVHKKKIELSDAILVINIDGYIGESTKREIEYAESLNKEIIYFSDLNLNF